MYALAESIPYYFFCQSPLRLKIAHISCALLWLKITKMCKKYVIFKEKLPQGWEVLKNENASNALLSLQEADGNTSSASKGRNKTNNSNGGHFLFYHHRESNTTQYDHPDVMKKPLGIP